MTTLTKTDNITMDQRIKKKWVAALRSGEFKQVKNKMACDGGFCCLGVLAEIYRKENMLAPDLDLRNGAYEKSGSFELPNQNVRRWANLKDSNPLVKYRDGWQTLSALNDLSNKTFAEIADIIEADPSI